MGSVVLSPFNTRTTPIPPALQHQTDQDPGALHPHIGTMLNGVTAKVIGLAHSFHAMH